MARRSPMEKRTPVRTISSVMRGAARPRVVMSPGKKPVTVTTKPAVSSVIRPASPAVKTTGIGTKPAVTTPVAPITSTTTKPTTPATSTTTKPAVAPISSTGNKPSVTPTKPTTSGGITSTVLGGAAGVASKALIDKLLGNKPTTPTQPTTGGAEKPVVTPKGNTTPTVPTTPTSTTPTSPVYQYPSSPTGGTPYDDEGNLNPGWQLDENNNPVWVGDQPATTPSAGVDTSNVASADQFYTDQSGNVYDGQGNLMYAFNNGKYYSPDGSLLYDPNADAVTSDSNITLADNIYVDPETGDTWTWDGSNWTTEETPVAGVDIEQPQQVASAPMDNVIDDLGWESAKNGGLITMMKDGGSVPHFADGNLVDETGAVTDYAISPETGDLYKPLAVNEYGDNYVPVLGSQGYAPRTMSTPIPTATPMATSNDFYAIDSIDNGDGTYTIYFSDGSEETFDNVDAAQAAIEASPPPSTPTPEQWPSGYVSNGDGTATMVMDDGSTMTIDANGDIVSATDATSTGTTPPTQQTQRPVTPIGPNRPQTAAPSVTTTNQPVDQNQKNILEKLYDQIGGSKGVAAGAAGALLANMIASGQFSGGNTAGAKPDDIAKMTEFAPRTTSFGPGMTGGRTGTGSTVVDYANYAQPSANQYVPDERLLSDLGVSGYLNEPDMTDYVDAEGNPVNQYGEALNTPEEPQMAGGGSTTHYTFGRVIDPAQNLGLSGGEMKKGGLSSAHTLHSHDTNPVVQGRIDFRHGSSVNGPGDGQSDDIPAMLADGEYVIDAELVAMLGNGSNKAGAKVLDKFREEVRAHKRGADLNKIPPKAKSPLAYLKEAMNG